MRATYDNRKPFVASLAALISLAWLALWFWGRPGGPLHEHHSGLHTFGDGAGFMLVFVLGWTVMVVAMMLPTSLPLISLFRAFVRRRRWRIPLVALLVTGYLVTWTLFGVLVYFGGWALRLSVERSAWLAANGPLLGAGVLLAAGVYQFTPLKYRCLDRCRSPLSFIVENWRGDREALRSFRLGVHHGLFCVGCCWSLMLLMFLVGGVGSLGWMLALGAVMAVEKNVSWGKRIGVPLGVLLVGVGLTLGTAQALRPSEESTGTTIEVPLAPADGSSVSGAATFTDTAGGVRVRLDVRGLPAPGATYLAHIHPGSCAEGPADGAHEHRDDTGHGDHPGDAGDTLGEIEHPLSPLVPTTDGGASGVTEIEDATVARLFSVGPGHYVNVHAEASGSGDPPALACGDLRENDGPGRGAPGSHGPRFPTGIPMKAAVSETQR